MTPMSPANTEAPSPSYRRIVDATKELLTQRPAGDIRMTDIVAAAQTTRPTFYAAVGDAEGALAAALNEKMAEVVGEQSLRGITDDGPARMEEVLRRFLETIWAERRFFTHALDGPTAPLAQSLTIDFIAERLLEHSPAGSPLRASTLTPRTAAHALAAGVAWLVIDELPRLSPHELPALAATLRHFVLDSLVGGLSR